ncbi:DUF3866 family protein [Paenibacillus ginsengihumi]|uniref:DUF3866 family protein n=1 Tax=Paenibacillus ginsengihumi TaxID=431596 RepID=UPI00035D4077|nr:DUF3866 family protein [Paenibacillus ginsengihumi]
MGIRFQEGVVTQASAVPESGRREALQQVMVDTGSGQLSPALHDTELLPPLRPGDRVLLNTTAGALGLGTGGVHFVHAVLSRQADDKVATANVTTPVTPAAPEAETAVAPESPETPVTSKTSETAVALEMLETPVMLEMSEISGTSETAESPAIPQTPESPETSETPVAPANSAPAATGEPISAPSVAPRQEGHIIKLRYTSLQRAVLAAEEEASPHRRLFAEPGTLEGMPVLIGELHSMLPIAAAWIRATELRRRGRAGGCRIAYVMSDAGALPLAFSRHVRQLSAMGWIAGSVTYGHAYGGDLEAVNKFTALLAARRALKADIAIAAMGPGIVGTGTALGYSGIETGELINAARALGGRPVYIPRVSFADPRERHRGLSHHSLTALTVSAREPALVPLPLLGREQTRRLSRQAAVCRLPERHDVRWVQAARAEDIGQALALYPEPVTTMGRGLAEDYAFFAAVCAAAEEALTLAEERR